MATTILAQPSTAADARFESHRTAYIEEFTALAQERLCSSYNHV